MSACGITSKFDARANACTPPTPVRDAKALSSIAVPWPTNRAAISGASDAGSRLSSLGPGSSRADVYEGSALAVIHEYASPAPAPSKVPIISQTIEGLTEIGRAHV